MGAGSCTFRVYDGRSVSLAELVCITGLSIRALEKIAKGRADVTARVRRAMWNRSSIDEVRAAASRGVVPLPLVRMRIYRGWTIDDATTRPVRRRAEGS